MFLIDKLNSFVYLYLYFSIILIHLQPILYNYNIVCIYISTSFLCLPFPFALFRVRHILKTQYIKMNYYMCL